jgi:hypothetical protein
MDNAQQICHFMNEPLESRPYLHIQYNIHFNIIILTTVSAIWFRPFTLFK